jgi:hypothetical protein
MTHRTDRVYLSDDQCRCDPYRTPCHKKEQCARYMAEIPSMGALDDFSGMYGLGGVCPQFMSIVRLRPSGPAKPATHEYVRGLA